MRKVSISHGKDGYFLSVRDEPWWTRPWEFFWDKTCVLTGHRACGAGWKSDWFWKHTWPGVKPVWDEGWLDNSIASSITDMWNKTENIPYSRGTHVILVPITESAARAFDSEFVDHMHMIEIFSEDDDAQDSEV